jgi:hypothetical protein
MRLLRFLRLSSLVLTVLVPAATTGRAAIYTYTYTGNPFTFAENDGGVTTSDFLSGALTLSLPLAPNSELMPLNPAIFVSFSFTDGIHTFTNPSALSFAAGADGDITSWTINATLTAPDGGSFALISDNASPNFVDETAVLNSQGTQTGDAFVLNNPGKWVIAAPEPSALGLMAMGFGALALLRLRHATPRPLDRFEPRPETDTCSLHP